MSHYCENLTVFQVAYEDCLVQALEEMGFKGKIEIHQEPQHLYGYRGDKRPQKAHIIIRRGDLQQSANDMGFERMPHGLFKQYVSTYDSPKFGKKMLDEVEFRYGINVAKKEARRQGYRINERRMANGQVQLEFLAAR